MKSMKLVLIFTNPVLIQPSVGFFYHEASVSSFSPWRPRYVIYPERWVISLWKAFNQHQHAITRLCSMMESEKTVFRCQELKSYKSKKIQQTVVFRRCREVIHLQFWDRTGVSHTTFFGICSSRYPQWESSARWSPMNCHWWPSNMVKYGQIW